MSVELFMIMISTISVVTGLVVEAIKSYVKTDMYNLIAGIVALIISVAVSICYALWYAVRVDEKYVIFFVCVAFASWLSAMVGFDKVKQAIIQIGVK